ncbi:MAG: CRTAC1 family protein [Planctomycetota bacterium]|nr:CRTAC1 family protein [Planctomycetota bacterium]
MNLAIAIVCGIGVLVALFLALFEEERPNHEPQSQPEVAQFHTDQQGTPIEHTDFRFTSMTDCGIDFVHESGTSADKPFPAANGSGIGAVDFDRDGNLDLYFLTGTPFPLDSSRSSPMNRLYRNLGDWQFRDVSVQTGVAHNGYSAGVAVADFDNDGFPDVYVACYGANILYHNSGDGTFEQLPDSAGVSDERWATSAACLDFNNDGFLDIYVCNYAEWSPATNKYCGDRKNKVRIFCSPKSVKPVHDALLRNNGDGTFTDVLEEVGCAGEARRGQGVIAADFDGDRHVDIYVGNDLHPNSLFISDGHGRFVDRHRESGAGFSFFGASQAGMGVDAADFNRDGRFDLFVTNYAGEHNAFYENRGDGLFDETSHGIGLAASSMSRVGWGAAFVDLDTDGWEDLVVTNGHTDDNLAELGRDGDYAQRPLVFRNHHGRFNAAEVGGDYFAKTSVGRALVVADLDNDGDSDLVVGHQDGPPAILRNDSVSAPICARFTCVGRRSNRDGIGTLMTLSNGEFTMTRQVKGGGSYLSAHDYLQLMSLSHEAWPPRENSEIAIKVRWPSGTEAVLERVVAGSEYFVVESHEEFIQSAFPSRR